MNRVARFFLRLVARVGFHLHSSGATEQGKIMNTHNSNQSTEWGASRPLISLEDCFGSPWRFFYALACMASVLAVAALVL